MNRTHKVFGTFVGGRIGLGLVLMRAVAGLAMAVHGYPKIQDPMGWAGDQFPQFLQALAAVAEFVGGVGLMLGLLTPLCCLGIFATMFVAVMGHSGQGHAWIGKGPTSELASIYLVVSLFFLIAGGGKYSLDYLIFGKALKE